MFFVLNGEKFMVENDRSSISYRDILRAANIYKGKPRVEYKIPGRGSGELHPGISLPMFDKMVFTVSVRAT